MACACAKNRAAAAGGAAPSGTYRVMVGTRQVYESTREDAAQTVAARFTGAVVLAPGVKA